MHNIYSLLNELAIRLPEPPKPGGSYVSVNVRGSTAYVAIQFPIENNQYLFTGRLGKDLSTEAGYQAARLAAINVLAQIETYVGFENLAGLNHVDIYYQADEVWDDGPVVANGASDLFVKVLGPLGTHTRAIFGVHRLPRNFSVGLTASFSLNNKHHVDMESSK
jgi:enamine deaminase RidA (YjgF/YER057c/UK114 family)